MQTLNAPMRHFGIRPGCVQRSANQFIRADPWINFVIRPVPGMRATHQHHPLYNYIIIMNTCRVDPE